MSKIAIDRSLVEQALEALWTAATPKAEEAIATLRTALEQPQVEQSSVVGVIGWKNHLPNSGTVVHWTALMPPLGTKLYIHPQPPRQPLTEMEIVELRQLTPGTLDVQFVKFARVIEAAHHITGEQA